MKSSRLLFLALVLVAILSLVLYRHYGQQGASPEVASKEISQPVETVTPTPMEKVRATATPQPEDKAPDSSTPTAAEKETPTPTKAAPVQKSAAATPWEGGTYRGFLPCASCRGIFTTVVLKSDKTYEKEEIYLGEKDGIFHEEGRILFGENPSKITLETKDNDISYNYQVEQDGLRMLDSEGNPSLGELADMYRLQKMSQRDIAFGEKPVTGYLTIGHEVSVFSPCGSERTYWIDDPEDNLPGLYKEALGEDTTPYTPVMAELKVTDQGKAKDGFAEDYPSVLEVTEIISVKPLTEENSCLY